MVKQNYNRYTTRYKIQHLFAGKVHNVNCKTSF